MTDADALRDHLTVPEDEARSAATPGGLDLSARRPRRTRRRVRAVGRLTLGRCFWAEVFHMNEGVAENAARSEHSLERTP